MAKRGGFPGGGMPGNMANLMKQAQKMQRQMEEQQKELETKEFTAAAGGGAVEVTISGKREVTKVKLDEEVVDPDDVEMLEDLVVAAVIAIIVSMVLYIAGRIMTFSEFWDTFVKGFSDMLPIIILLISALTFQKIASEMKMTEFFVDICKPFMVGSVFPMITFIIVGLLAFMIANAWGVCTLVAPVLIPLGASVGANIVLVMAAIL